MKIYRTDSRLQLVGKAWEVRSMLKRLAADTRNPHTPLSRVLPSYRKK